MSLMFKPPAHFDPDLVPKMLDENALLIKIITEYQNNGKIRQSIKYQEVLTRNLLYLSAKANFNADQKAGTSTNFSNEHQ